MNELIEQIKRDAVTIQQLTEQEKRTFDTLNTTLTERDAAYHEVRRLAGELAMLETERKSANEERAIVVQKASELGMIWAESLPEFMTRAVPMVKQIIAGRDDAEKRIAKYAEDRALMDAWHSISLENGREPDELMGDYMVRIWNALDVAQRFAEDQKQKLQTAEKRIEEKDAEIGKLISLSNERALEMTKLKESHSDTSDGLSSLQIENLKRQLQTAKDDLERQHIRETKISAEYQADIKKILTTANKLGRADYESPEAFMNRQAADMESQARQLNLVRQELGDKTQKVIELSRWHEENLEKIKGLEADLAHSRSQESPEATRNALRNVTADRDRIRTELAAIIAEANKSGRCNGDPVQLLKQGQVDLDLLTHLEANCAGLDRLVEQLRGELAEARAQQKKADPEDMKAKLREAKQDYEIVRVQLARIAKTAKRCGRTDKESVIDFMNRQQRERGAERAASNAACSQAVGQLERRLAEIQAVANRSNRLACDPIALIIQGQRDHMTLTELLKERPRIDANSNGHPVSGDSKEVFRLSEFIAELQVELDEARGKYSDIVAALENETLQQLIKRTDRSAKEQNASLKAQLEKVQAILRQEMKDHQAAREAMTAAYKAAGVSGMRHDEELPAFINRLSALVATLQVELDDAKRKYGDIMAALGNETPLDAVYRLLGWPIKEGTMQTPSTIPHDERAKLVWEIADLRKRLDEKQKAHAKLHYDFVSVANCARNHGLRKDEDLKVFITRKCNELTGALNFGDRMQDMANQRGQALDAAMATVANQSAAIAEAQRVTEKYTGACTAANKLKDWASTVRNKVLVKIVHDKAMQEYDTIIKELDGEAVANGS